jgi:hypothetical protein
MIYLSLQALIKNRIQVQPIKGLRDTVVNPLALPSLRLSLGNRFSVSFN